MPHEDLEAFGQFWLYWGWRLLTIIFSNHGLVIMFSLTLLFLVFTLIEAVAQVHNYLKEIKSELEELNRK